MTTKKNNTIKIKSSEVDKIEMRKRHEMRELEGGSTKHEEEASAKERNSIHSVPFFVGSIFVILLCGLYGIVFLIDDSLPSPLHIGDEYSYKDRFIAERAQNDLKQLTSIGPRTVGSKENEFLAVEFFKRKIAAIQKFAHPDQKIEVDIQSVSGSFFLDFTPHGLSNSYGQVQNVIVKLHAEQETKYSLLLNAHFDTVPTSPGGSDDGINCVSMLEVLNKLSKSSTRFKHNIIFLFNGAEESILQGSHGFIKHHKWAPEVPVVINLEAAGAGGKEMLFQAGPSRPWLLKYYQKVPHPNGQVLGEEMFRSGIIPSDTDFRIFRDFGNVVGLDFAFARGGYRYHTKFDNYSNIPLGSYQHVGDNVLSLVRNLANSPELSDSQNQLQVDATYFDVFGLFFVSYSETVAIIIHSIVAAVSFIIAIKSFYEFGLLSSIWSILYIFLLFGVILLSWILAAGVVLFIAFLLGAMKSTMSWYSNPWLLFGLYSAPVFGVCCGTMVLFNQFQKKNNLSISAHTQIQLHLVRLIWTIILLVGTGLGIRTTYTIFVPLLFHTLAFSIIHIFCQQRSVRTWQIVYVIGTIIPTMFIMQVSTQIIGVLVPISGRMGADKNPEMLVGVLILLITLLITSFYAPLVTLQRRPSVLLTFLSIIIIISFIIVITPLGFPYRANLDTPKPQRLLTVHLSRVFRNDENQITKKDSGYFIVPLDYNGPSTVKNHLSNLTFEPIIDDCKQSLFCGLPLVNVRIFSSLDQSKWLQAEEPKLDEPIILTLLDRSIIDSVTRFSFEATGPPAMSIYISPKANKNLSAISLVPELPKETIIWNDRPAYLITYVWGVQNTPLLFSVDFTELSNSNEPTFDIALSGRYVTNNNNISPAYRQFLNYFPDWADIVPSLGAYESFTYK